jgi:hypothetical protein
MQSAIASGIWINPENIGFPGHNLPFAARKYQMDTFGFSGNEVRYHVFTFLIC